MHAQRVSYYTLAWDQDARLMIVPILERRHIFRAGDRITIQYIEDDIAFVAKDRQCIIVILDKEKFGLDDWGNGSFKDIWSVSGQIVRAKDIFGASLALDFVQKQWNSERIQEQERLLFHVT
jgi:hypothetical protein